MPVDTSTAPVAPSPHRNAGGLARLRPLWVPAVTAVLLGAGWWLESGMARPPGTSGVGPWARAMWPAFALYAAAYVVGGWESARSGVASLLKGRIDIDFLMVAAAVGAFSIGQARDGAVLIFIFALSNALEHYALARTRRAIEALVGLRPTRARRVRMKAAQTGSTPHPQAAGGGTELPAEAVEIVPVEALAVGDVVEILPGERVPADGRVREGTSAVDASAITGESLPVEKGPGDEVLAGSVNQYGLLRVQVTKAPQDSTLARVIELVRQARERQGPTQMRIERFEGVYSAAVVLATVGLVVAGPVALGWPFRETLLRAMTVMVVASPCAVVLSSMPALLSALATGARRGVLFKGALYLEQLAAVKVVAFDKTGTLTTGRPAVTEVVTLPGWTEEAVLTRAAGAESGSEHPIARAIVREAHRRGYRVVAPRFARALPGRGVEGEVAGDRVRVGSPAWFRELGHELPPALARALHRLESGGQTAMLVEVNGSGPVAVIGVADRVRPQAKGAVAALKRLGVRRVVMLTGDNPRVAAAIAGQVGVDAFYAGLLPEDKMRVLEDMRARYGPVAMVGDGINDAPALAAADVGVAMGGAGTDVALETADVVLMSDDLGKLEGAVAIGRQAARIVRQNLAFAFGVIAVLLMLAAGGYLNLTQGVVGHEGSTVLVALNGLRLLSFRWPRGRPGDETEGQLEVAAQAT